MNVKYKKYEIIEDYRIALDETWEVFGSRFAEETGVPWKTLYKTVHGITSPNARTAHKIELWYNKHIDDMVVKITEHIHSLKP